MSDSDGITPLSQAEIDDLIEKYGVIPGQLRVWNDVDDPDSISGLEFVQGLMFLVVGFINWCGEGPTVVIMGRFGREDDWLVQFVAENSKVISE